MASPPTLPDLPPQTPQPPPEDASQPPRPSSSGSSNSRSVSGAYTAADGKPAPIPYGRVFLDGMIGPLRVHSSTIVGSQFFCVGEIDAIEAVYFDQRPGGIWNDGTHGSSITVPFPETNTLDFLRLTQYHGLKNQIVDPDLATFFPGYADDNVYRDSGQEVGLVYIVFLQKIGGAVNPARLRVKVRGLRVWDPRLSGGAGGLAWSQNPALHLADFLIAPYGCGLQVDWDSVTVVADRCDDLIGGKPRWSAGTLIEDASRPGRQIDRLRALANCMVRLEGSTAYLTANAPAASVITFGSSEIVRDSLRFSHRSQLERPTRVEVRYTRTESGGAELIPWDTDVAVYEPIAPTPQRQRVTTRINLPGFQTHESAYRYAVQEYRLRQTDRWELSFRSRDYAAATVQGDVITVQHEDLVGASMAFRASRVRQQLTGSGVVYNIDAVGYDGSVFSDDDVADPGSLFPTNVDPNAPPSIDAGTLEAEEIIGPNQSGQIVSQVRVQFEPVDWPALTHYRINLVGPNTNLRWDVPPTAKTIVTESPDLSNVEVSDQTLGELFVVKVRVVSTTNALSSPAKKNVRVLGKYAPPPDVSRFITLSHVQGRTFMVVEPVVDIGPVLYKARYSPGTDVGWDLAFPVNDSSSSDNRITHDGFADETSEDIYYYVKAVDNVGVESVNALKGKVTTDPQLWDEFREVVFEFGRNDLDPGKGHDFFVYGEGDFVGTFQKTVTWEERLGTTDIPVRNASTEWFDGTGIVPDEAYPYWPAGDFDKFDLGVEKMRRVAADGSPRNFRAGAGEVYDIGVGIIPITFSLLYGIDNGPANGNLTTSCRNASFVFANDPPTPIAANEYAEFELPIAVVARKILHDQGGNVINLGAGDLPYTVVFDDAYSEEPLLQVTFVDDRSGSNVEVTDLTATSFEVDRVSGGGSLTWSMSWRAIGE